jgi:hypothetical protein
VSFIEVPDPTKTRGRKRLLFRYDPERRLVEIQGAEGTALVDLTKYDPSTEDVPAKPGTLQPIDAQPVEEVLKDTDLLR